MKKSIVLLPFLSLGIANAAEETRCALSQKEETVSSVRMHDEKAEHYHGIPNAQHVYDTQSQQAISSIESMLSFWTANPEQLTQPRFWNLISLLGKKRRDIATTCKSQDVNDFGVPRGTMIIPTGTKGYKILENTGPQLVKQPEHALLDLIDNIPGVIALCEADMKAVEKANLKLGTLESCTFLMQQNTITAGVAFLNCYLQAVIRDKNRARATTIYGKYFKENDRISRVFYTCLVPQDYELAVFSDLYTCDSALKDSSAISELYELLKSFVEKQKPDAAFAFFHKFAVTMPYKRGSCAVNEWILEAACQTIGTPMPQQSCFAEFDQTAQISTRDEFVQFMMAKIQPNQ